MNDSNAFERLVADVADDLMGPSRPFDAAAIVRSARTMAPRHRWADVVLRSVSGRVPSLEGGIDMFSALKFVAASVIVALFGGLLLAGILTAPQGDEMAPAAVTESPSPMTTEEVLSGMVSEEVEPGVYRVINDGARDLRSVEAVDIVAGYDGGIWLLREDGFLRLGSDASHGWPAIAAPGENVFEVAPDGTMWVIPEERRGAGVRSTDGVVWTVQPCPAHDCAGFTVASDGTVWASWAEEGDRWRVGHLGATGWQPLDGYALSAWSSDQGSGPQPTSINYDRLFVTDAGDLYGAECWADVESGCYLHRYGDGDWLGGDLYGVGYFNYAKVLDVGSDGTVWLEGVISDEFLSRIADGEWVVYTPADLPDVGLGLDYQFEVAPDGSLWSSLWRSAEGGEGWLGKDPNPGWEEQMAAVEDGRLVCDGLARFDGESLDRFLPGRCVTIDIAADGSVWVLADEDEGKGLYVITPEAVAGTE